MNALSAFVTSRRRLVIILWAALFAVALGVLAWGGTFESGDIPGLEARKADLAAIDVESAPRDTMIIVIFSSPTMSPRDTEFRVARDLALAPLRKDPRVLSVRTADDASPFIRQKLVNASARTEMAYVTLQGPYRDAQRAYPSLRAALRSPALEITCTGRIPYMSDLDATLAHDLLFAEAISLPLALLVLLYSFRTLAAALIPVVSGALSVVIAVAIITALSRVSGVAQYAVNVTSLIGLGVAIDYSLFLVSRHREELSRGCTVNESIATAIATAGRAAAFSGLAVAVGLGGLFFFRGSYLVGMGIGGAVVVLLSVLVSVTFVPALLSLLGANIHWGALRRRARAGSQEPRPESTEIFRRLAEWVMRRPLLVLIPTVTLLLFAAQPVLRLSVSAADVRVLDARSEARRGLDLLTRDFPDQARTRLVLVVLFPSAPALNAERIDALYTLSRSAAKLPHVVRVESIVDRNEPDNEDEETTAAFYEELLLRPAPLYAPIIDEAKKLTVGERVAVLYVSVDAKPDSASARALVRTLREKRNIADGVLLVGGAAANDVDTTDFMRAHAPSAAVFIVLVTLIVLFLQLQSVLLPLKAVVMNMLSIGASFGALVWIFEDGHLFVHEGRPLEPTLPVLLFAVIFGLSMDYEVLMLARIREERMKGKDNTAAIAVGLEKTAGLVTRAAAIMITVFAAFALSRVVLLSAVGVGMALAVAIDATLVRVLLVPATMRLLGEWNWWSPFAPRKPSAPRG